MLTLEIIKVLLVVFGIIGPATIAIYMLLFVCIRRCPLCGAKMKVHYKGKYVDGYKCEECKHFEVKEIGKK